MLARGTSFALPEYTKACEVGAAGDDVRFESARGAWTVSPLASAPEVPGCAATMRSQVSGTVCGGSSFCGKRRPPTTRLQGHVRRSRAVFDCSACNTGQGFGHVRQAAQKNGWAHP
ncbi:hypothetical protein DIPPA_01059 [Diplonema papillatum]|nr:hypothetical protein DIPPA_01059 [Diplonema papillatum]